MADELSRAQNKLIEGIRGVTRMIEQLQAQGAPADLLRAMEAFHLTKVTLSLVGELTYVIHVNTGTMCK